MTIPHFLYANVHRQDLKLLPTKSLALFLSGYIRLYNRMQIDEAIWPGLSQSKVSQRLNECSRLLAERMKTDGCAPDEQARYALLLMDAYRTPADEEMLDLSLGIAYDRIDPDGSNRLEADLSDPLGVELLVALDYFVPEDGCGDLAAGTMTTWAEAQKADGTWEDLPVTDALDRLSAMIRYSTQIGTLSFHTALERGSSRYAGRIDVCGEDCDSVYRKLKIKIALTPDERTLQQVGQELDSLGKIKTEIGSEYLPALFDLYGRIEEAKLYGIQRLE